MTTDATLTAATPRTYPADEWVRSITFFDAPSAGDEVPVHLTLGILINDKPVYLRVPRHHEWSVIGGFERESVVSFVVHEGDVQMGRFDADGTHHPATLAGLKCLTPADPAMLWARLNAYRPTLSYPTNRKTGRVSAYPADTEGTYEWVRVFLQVREVKVVAGGLPED